jgi:transposase
MARSAARSPSSRPLIDKLTHEMAVLKRLKFAASSERFSARAEEPARGDAGQRPGASWPPRSSASSPAKAQGPRPSKPQARAAAGAPAAPRDPPRARDTTCGCGCAMKRIGEDVAEKLDYVPGVFTVERHMRGKWACARSAARRWCRRRCRRTSSTRASPPPACWPRCWWPSTRPPAAVPAGSDLRARRAMADRALDAGAVGGRVRRAAAAAGGRPGGRAAAPRGAARRRDAGGDAQARPRQDAPGLPLELLHDGFNPIKAVVFDFAESRAAASTCATSWAWTRHNAKPGWKGTLVTDDFSGYKACFELGVTEAGCMAHARRKFHELWANHGSAGRRAGAEVLRRAVRRRARGPDLDADERRGSDSASHEAGADALHRVAAGSSGRRCRTARPPPRPSTTA